MSIPAYTDVGSIANPQVWTGINQINASFAINATPVNGGGLGAQAIGILLSGRVGIQTQFLVTAGANLGAALSVDTVDRYTGWMEQATVNQFTGPTTVLHLEAVQARGSGFGIQTALEVNARNAADGNFGIDVQMSDVSSDRAVTITSGGLSGNPNHLTLRHSRGSTANPTAVSGGDVLSAVAMMGYDGSAYQPVARIRAEVDGTVSAGVTPGRLVFMTSSASGALREVSRMTKEGILAWGTTQIGGASAGDIVIPNNQVLRGVNAAGSSTIPLIGSTNIAGVVSLAGGYNGGNSVIIGGLTSGNLAPAGVNYNGVIVLDTTNNRFCFYINGQRFYVTGTPF